MLIDRVDAYLRRTKTSPTRFGRDAVGDPNFVLDLRDGRVPRIRTIRRVIAFIEQAEASRAALEQRQ